MIICFNANKEAKRALDALIETGQFKDTSEAISVALLNYEVIQLAVDENHGVLRDNASSTQQITIAPVLAGAADKSRSERDKRPSEVTPSQIPDLFRLFERRPSNEDLLQAEVTHADYKALTPKDWMFGQWNRYLPAKATSRALLNIMCEQHSGIPVKDAANKISLAACDLGDYLRMLDARHSLRREDSVSAAFPSAACSGGEGRLRYGNQFVGTIKQGRLISMPAALHLVDYDSAKDPNLRLTKAGAQFAALPNPLLDHGITSPTSKFTDEEISFLLQHILLNVPEEVSAFAAVIDAVIDGANTPEKIDTYLRNRFGFVDEAAMTATFLSTQRTGVISRLADLGLINREKAGIRVTYNVSQFGKTFRGQIA